MENCCDKGSTLGLLIVANQLENDDSPISLGVRMPCSLR